MPPCTWRIGCLLTLLQHILVLLSPLPLVSELVVEAVAPLLQLPNLTLERARSRLRRGKLLLEFVCPRLGSGELHKLCS